MSEKNDDDDDDEKVDPPQLHEHGRHRLCARPSVMALYPTKSWIGFLDDDDDDADVVVDVVGVEELHKKWHATSCPV